MASPLGGANLLTLVPRYDRNIVIVNALTLGQFPVHLKPSYERLIRELVEKCTRPLSTVEAKFFHIVCTCLAFQETRFRVDLKEAAQLSKFDRTSLENALDKVQRTILPRWKNIFAEETAAFISQGDPLIRDDSPVLKAFIRSLDVQSLSETRSVSVISLIVATYQVFRRKKGLDINAVDIVAEFEIWDSNQYERAYSVTVKHYVRNLKRDSVVDNVNAGWCTIEPGVTPGTTVPQINVLMTARASIREYAEMIHTPAVTEELANMLYRQITSVYAFISSHLPNVNLSSMYLAALFLAEVTHGTQLNCHEFVMITDKSVEDLQAGLEEFNALFPKLGFINTVTSENARAIEIFAKRLSFTQDQVVATQELSARLSRMYPRRHFLTRASIALYIKGVEYGHTEQEMYEKAPIITFVRKELFSEFRKVVFKENPDLLSSLREFSC